MQPVKRSYRRLVCSIVTYEESKEFIITLPDSWVDVPIGYELEFRMVHGTEGFGDTVSREVMMNPYMKTASWNRFGIQSIDSIAVYFKSTRSDINIDVLAMRCNGNACDEASAIETLPPNKAVFNVFTATALNGQTYGELKLYYVPREEKVLSDKDIIASFSDSFTTSGKKLKFLDAAFEERFTKLGTRLIAPYFDVTGNRDNYVMIHNDSPEELSYTMTLRWLSGTYTFTDLPAIPAFTTAKLYLNELIGSKGITADRGSIELNYAGQNGVVTAMNHISGQKTYDVPFIDVASYGAGMLTVPYFKISANFSTFTKIWLQNATNSVVTITFQYYDLMGISLLSKQMQLGSSEWKEINVSSELPGYLEQEGSIEIFPSVGHSIIGHSAVEYNNRQYAEDIGVKDPGQIMTRQMHGTFWKDQQSSNHDIDIRTRLYIHNNNDLESLKAVMIKEYGGTTGGSESQEEIVPSHGTVVVELENNSSNIDPLETTEAGFEVEQEKVVHDDGFPGDLVVSASVINVLRNAVFQVPVVSNYCGSPSKLENHGLWVDCTGATGQFSGGVICQIIGLKLAHTDYIGEGIPPNPAIIGYRLYWGDTRGQWTQITEYPADLAYEFYVAFGETTTGKFYFALEILAECGQIGLSNIVEVSETALGGGFKGNKSNDASGKSGINQIIENGSAVMGTFKHGKGHISWASVYGEVEVSNVKVYRQKEGSSAELIYDGTDREGIQEEFMPVDGYKYWSETQCADNSYQQTPPITPESGRNTAPVPTFIRNFFL